MHYGEAADIDSLGEQSPEIMQDEEQSIDAVNDGLTVNLPEIGGTYNNNRYQMSTSSP